MKLTPRCPLNVPPPTDTGSITLCTTAGLNSRSNYPFAYHQGYHLDLPLCLSNAQNHESPNPLFRSISSLLFSRYLSTDIFILIQARFLRYRGPKLEFPRSWHILFVNPKTLLCVSSHTRTHCRRLQLS